MSALRFVADIGDLRALARRRMPRPIFDFIDGGSFSQSTRRENVSDFEKLKFRQRVAVDISARTTATTLLGQPAAMPCAISPTGMSGMIHGGNDGEIMAARAAKAAGIPYTLGMISMQSIETLARVVDDFWFQLCMLNDRDLMSGMMRRAHAAGCPVLVLTLTWPITTRMFHLMRHRDATLPPVFTPQTILTYARKPAWAWRALTGGSIQMANFVPHRPVTLWDIPSLLNAAATWDDVRWVRDQWPGRLVIKGVMTAEDTEAAVRSGADAVSVSNHGGNQLDGAPSTIAALPGVVAAAGGRVDVLLDGGVRTGQDVLRCLALGAKGVLLGRAHLYGLGAAGEAGVAKALEIIQAELDITMGLCGLIDPQHASPALLV
jgi:L-lactate dehydrogenase (cytochrome)